MNRLFEAFVKFIYGKSRAWRAMMTALSALIVFSTTYALILPAITLDSNRVYDEPGIELDDNYFEDVNYGENPSDAQGLVFEDSGDIYFDGNEPDVYIEDADNGYFGDTYFEDEADTYFENGDAGLFVDDENAFLAEDNEADLFGDVLFDDEAGLLPDPEAADSMAVIVEDMIDVDSIVPEAEEPADIFVDDEDEAEFVEVAEDEENEAADVEAEETVAEADDAETAADGAEVTEDEDAETSDDAVESELADEDDTEVTASVVEEAEAVYEFMAANAEEMAESEDAEASEADEAAEMTEAVVSDAEEIESVESQIEEVVDAEEVVSEDEAESVSSDVEEVMDAAESVSSEVEEAMDVAESVSSEVEEVMDAADSTLSEVEEMIDSTDSTTSEVEDIVTFDEATWSGAESMVESVPSYANGVEDIEEVYPAVDFYRATPYVSVKVHADEGAFPAGTTMTVEDVEDEETITAITEAAEETEAKVRKLHAVNITFLNVDGQEIEPLIPISVEIRSEQIAEDEKAMVVHVDDDGNATALSDVEVEAKRNSAVAEVTKEGTGENSSSGNSQIDEPDSFAEAVVDAIGFEADEFSVYAIVYTVDFEYSVNGKIYRFSLPGGGFVSFTDLVEVLGISKQEIQRDSSGVLSDPENDVYDADEVQEVNQQDISDQSGCAPLTLGDIEISEDTRKFVAEVENVEFSNPELLWVGKIENENTVGGVKEEKGIEVEYSAELTKEQISELNEQMVEAGDWALISMHPFASEEKLNVTMRNGDQFVIKVTDAMDTSKPYNQGAVFSGYNNREDGFTINLFDYGPEDQLDNGNTVVGSTNGYMNSGINAGHTLKFTAYGKKPREVKTNGQNVLTVNHFSGSDAATQGIVENNLSGGYPKLNGGESLSYLFNTSGDGNNKVVYKDVTGLFQKDSDGKYYYDSNVNYAYYNPNQGDGGTFQLSDTFPEEGSDFGVGFFPFNQWNGEKDCIHWNGYCPRTGGNNSGRYYYNHHFGMTLEGSFQMTPSGTLNGKDMTFNFSGDDDLWVFIDDVLVLDIGGIHNPVGGSIDFHSGEVRVDSAYQVGAIVDNDISPSAATTSLQAAFAAAGKTWDPSPYSEHTIKVFYMERGGCYSNCRMEYNLTRFKDLEFDKKDQYGDPIKDAEFGLYKEDDTPLMETYLGDNNEFLEKPYVRKSDSNGHVKFDHVPAGTYYLKELDVPEGYAEDDAAYSAKIVVTKQENGQYTVTSTVLRNGQSTDTVLNTKLPVIDIGVEKKWLDVDGQPMDASDYSAVFTLRRTKSWTEIKEEEGEPQKTSTLQLGYVNGNGTHNIYQGKVYNNFVAGSTVTISYDYDDSHRPEWNNHRYYKIGQNGQQNNLNDSGSFTVTMPSAGETLTVYFYDGFNNNSYWSGEGKYNAFTSLTATGQAPQSTINKIEIPHEVDDTSFSKTLTLSNGATSGKFDSGLYAGTADAGKFPCKEVIKQDGKDVTYTYKYYITEQPVSGFTSSPAEAGPTGEEDFTGKFENRKLLTVKIKKIWDHGTNTGNKPTSLTVTLSNGQSVTLNEGNRWEATITDLPKYDSEGVLIPYTWTEEELPPGYYLSDMTETESNGIASTTLTNSYTDHYMPETNISGKKIWDDYGNENRPASITVKLYQGNSADPYRTITVNAPTGDGANTDEWPFEFTNLPVFDEDGKVIQYRVEEVLPDGYSDTYNIKPEFTQETYIPGEITGNIVDSGQGSQTFKVSKGVNLGYIVIRHGNDFIIWTPRPASSAEIDIIKGKAVALSNKFNGIETASGNSLRVISGVPKTIDVGDKHAVSIYMQDDEVWMKFLNPNAWSNFVYGTIPYTYTPAGGSEGGTITNVKKVVDIGGTKTWIDGGRVHNNGQDITLTLKRKLDSENVWDTVQDATPTWEGNTYKFSNLPRYQNENDPSTEYKYKVEETAVNVTEGTGDSQRTVQYKQEDDDNGNFINTELLNIEATKTWKDGQDSLNSDIRNASVTFELQKKVGDGEWTAVPAETGVLENPQTLTVGNEADEEAWKAQWNGLPKYELVEGTELQIQYQVVETEAKISGIDIKPETNPTAEVADRVANIDNTLPETEISVTKQWKDGKTEAGGNDKVFDETKTISFTVYQKAGENEPVIYTAYGDNGKGTVTYTPGADSDTGSWSVENILDLPKYVYDETAHEWLEASYYVKEDAIPGVSVTYKRGTEEAVDTPEASAVTNEDEDSRTITIINTDILVPIKIVKVNKDTKEALTGASFQLTRKLPGERVFTKFEHRSFEADPESGKNTGPFTISSTEGIVLEDLHPGEYTIKEISAPEGYIITLQPFIFTISDDGSVSSSDADETLVVPLEKSEGEPEGFQIGNEPGAALPSTGGFGTKPFTIGGMMLVLMSLMLYCIGGRRRTLAEEFSIGAGESAGKKGGDPRL